MTRLLFSELDKNILYVGTTLGGLFSFDVRNGLLLKQYRGHYESIMELRENVKQNVLVTAGDDKRCLVFKI